MREIKFRAWDNVLNRFLSENSFEILANGKIMDHGEYQEREIKDINLEQCTGLKDKNKREIYEGDIIKSSMYDRPYSSKAKNYDVFGTVEWASGILDDGFQSDEPGFIVRVFKKSSSARGYDWSLFSRCEVIGNVHENPELLK